MTTEKFDITIWKKFANGWQPWKPTNIVDIGPITPTGLFDPAVKFVFNDDDDDDDDEL